MHNTSYNLKHNDEERYDNYMDSYLDVLDTILLTTGTNYPKYCKTKLFGLIIAN